MDTIAYRAQITSTQIGFLNSIIESYEGIGVVRTFDAAAGVVELWIAPDFEQLVVEIMRDLGDEIGVKTFEKVNERLSE